MGLWQGSGGSGWGTVLVQGNLDQAGATSIVKSLDQVSYPLLSVVIRCYPSLSVGGRQWPYVAVDGRWAVLKTHNSRDWHHPTYPP